MFDTDGAPQINDDANFNNNNSSSLSSFSFFFVLIESKCSMIRLHNKYEPSHAVKDSGTKVVVPVAVSVCAVVAAVNVGVSFVLSFGVSCFDSVPKLEPPLVSGATGGGDDAVVPNEKGDALAGVPKVLVVAAGDPKAPNDDAVLAGVLLADVPNEEVPKLLPTLPTLVVVAGGDPKAPNDDAVLAGVAEAPNGEV